MFLENTETQIAATESTTNYNNLGLNYVWKTVLTYGDDLSKLNYIAQKTSPKGKKEFNDELMILGNQYLNAYA